MEPLKDHYRSLNVSPKATTEEIKKVFRKLALQYHPDKNDNSTAATEKFTRIQEAYQILSDPKKRSAYNYQRYLRDPLRTNKPLAQTAEDVLLLSKKLDKATALLDPHRIDRDLLYFQVMEIVSAEHLVILREADDASINREIIQHIMAASYHLPVQSILLLAEKLNTLTDKDPLTKKEWEQFVDQSKQNYYWSKYKVWIALLIAGIVCFLIYLTRH